MLRNYQHSQTYLQLKKENNNNNKIKGKQKSLPWAFDIKHLSTYKQGLLKLKYLL